MPGKGRRAASRQAKVRQRRRRGKAAPQTFQAAPTESKTVTDEEDADVELQTERSARPGAAVAEAPRRARRARQATKLEAAVTQHFLGGELRRIGIFTLLMMALLAALSFTLGGG